MITTADKKYKMGLIVTPQLLRTDEEERLASLLHPDHTKAGLPTSIDWRKNPSNFTGPVRDQDGCGSCVAHSGVKVCAINRRVADNAPLEDVEMSAYDLFSHGGTCGNGWTLEAGGSAYKTYGACPQKCWDDDDIQQSCCAGNKYKTLGNTRVSSDSAAKQWIVDHGAVWAAMDVPESFFNVDSETVYHDDGAPIAGSHAVTLCGYDDAKGAWLLYNSWGSSWGVGGFCWIGYGECNLIRGYAAYGIQISSGPTPSHTGIQINTVGTLQADIYLVPSMPSDTLIGKTDGFISMSPGTYNAVIKKSGYADYPLKFTVVSDQTFTTTITMVSLYDIPSLSKSGVLTATRMSSRVKATLLVNDIAKGLTTQARIVLGPYLKGDSLTLKLLLSNGQIVHNVRVSPMGSVYLLQMGASMASKTDYVAYIQIK